MPHTASRVSSSQPPARRQAKERCSPRQTRSRLSQVDPDRLVSSAGLPCSSKLTQPAFGVISTRRVQKPGQLTSTSRRATALAASASRFSFSSRRAKCQTEKSSSGTRSRNATRMRRLSAASAYVRRLRGGCADAGDSHVGSRLRSRGRGSRACARYRSSSSYRAGARSIPRWRGRSPPLDRSMASTPISSLCLSVRPRRRARAAVTGCARAIRSTCASRGGTAGSRSASCTSSATSSTTSSGTSSARRGRPGSTTLFASWREAVSQLPSRVPSGSAAPAAATSTRRRSCGRAATRRQRSR